MKIALVILALIAAAAHAQEFPSKPIRIIVPFAPAPCSASSLSGTVRTIFAPRWAPICREVVKAANVRVE